ncbi:VWA domain-containing protein [Nocardioides marmotae]|uniref:VWA domain-containing protein n=1 Tax=Nocardioides marmotae TaxID=2663857 RepID=UPI0016599C16|nr:VWA domain-containing protein [Nocardioides marmotae]MBC9734264.1 VWA domain-containing protein [Nocardioides marmotae]
MSGSGLLDRHIAFLEALRSAGLSVSLAEDLDAIAALSALEWGSRQTVHAAYAATLVKKQSQRPTFDALFDLYFPRMVGSGAGAATGSGSGAGEGDGPDAAGQQFTVRDGAEALRDFRERLAEALAADDRQALGDLAAEMVARFGAMPGRGPGLSSWSAYTALQRVAPNDLVDRLVAGLLAEGRTEEEAERTAGRRVGGFTRLVEDDARRRIAEEKGPEHVANVALRPSIDRLDFLSARRTDLEQMRREIYPLARRLAARLTKEQHAQRRGPLDFRRTVRASISTGGVPLTTHHRPKRPHRTELVVLCDVSGSVANFAQFTLLLVFALRDQFQKVRAFTFIDHVHEVTEHFRPGADVVDVMADLAASTSHAALWGRTNYGRAITKLAENHADALGPKSSLLILGDARSNYSDLALDTLGELVGGIRNAWWLNPEHRRHWDNGDSAASRYGAVVPMVECRNLTQLGEFVHDIL